MKAWQATKNGVRTILVLVPFAFSDLWSCRCRSRNTTRRLCFGALLALMTGALCCVDGDVWQVAVPIPGLAFTAPTAQSAFSTHTHTTAMLLQYPVTTTDILKRELTTVTAGPLLDSHCFVSPVPLC